MYIDFIIALFLIICIFRGDKRGLLLSLVSTFGWIMSLASAYIFKAQFILLLDQKTTMRHDLTVKITEYIKNRLMAKAAGVDPDGTIPGSISSVLSSAAEKAFESSASAAAQPIADAIMTLLSFFILAFVVKFVMYFVEYVVRQFKKKDKVVRSFDHIMGMIFGLIKGCIVSYIVLMLVVMVSMLGDFTPVITQVQDSMVVNILDNAGCIPFSMDTLDTITETIQ